MHGQNGSLSSNGCTDYNNKYKPHIFVRFHNFNDRKVVRNKRFEFSGKYFSISENFAKAYLKGDKLVIDKSVYTIDDNLRGLPTDFFFHSNLATGLITKRLRLVDHIACSTSCPIITQNISQSVM